MPRTLVKPLIEACHEAFPLRISPQLIEDRPKRNVLRFGPIGPCQDQEICPAVAFPALVELPTVTHWSIRQRQLNLEFVHQGSPVAFSRNSVSARSSTCGT